MYVLFRQELIHKVKVRVQLIELIDDAAGANLEQHFEVIHQLN